MSEMVYILLLFPLAITLHNLEEALWLPQWSKYAQKFHKPVGKDEFRFAVIIVTLLAYLATGLFVLYPHIFVLKYFYFGLVGLMIVNAFIPHMAATIAIRKYAPGLMTGIFLMVPIDSLIIARSLTLGVISFYAVLISTVAVGLLVAPLLPVLFSLGRKLIKYD